MGVKIISTGISLPEKVLTNKDLEKMVDTTDEWIRERTGITSRRIAGLEPTSFYAKNAAAMAIKEAGIPVDKIGLIITGTTTPDHLFPSTSAIVQKELGIKRAFSIDTSAACSGFLFAFHVASSLIEKLECEYGVVIGADELSKFINWKDRTTCILFGDGAGAWVIKKDSENSILSFVSYCESEEWDAIYIDGGGSKYPSDSAHKPYIVMNGQKVYRNAIRMMEEACIEAIKKAGISKEDIKCYIPHQANLRIIKSLAEKLEIPFERVYVNVDKYGNISAATTPVAFHEALKKGIIKSGDLVLLTSIGSGFAVSACVLKT